MPRPYPYMLDDPAPPAAYDAAWAAAGPADDDPADPVAPDSVRADAWFAAYCDAHATDDIHAGPADDAELRQRLDAVAAAATAAAYAALERGRS